MKTVLYFQASGKISARELLSLKLKTYAYVPWPEPRFWSEERETGFAANDFMVAQVAAAANRVQLNIPDDVALVGVDNDELLCENTFTRISSS